MRKVYLASCSPRHPLACTGKTQGYGPRAQPSLGRILATVPMFAVCDDRAKSTLVIFSVRCYLVCWCKILIA